MAAFRSSYRRGGRWWAIGTTLVAAIVALVLTLAASAAKPPPPTTPAGPYQVPTGPLGQVVGFAGNDGGTNTPNVSSDYSPSATVDPNATNQPNFDWNSLATNPTYTGTAPFQHADGLTSGFQWTALTDASKSNSDTGFAGGTKQNDDCAAVIGSSAPNKDDLKRAYIAAKTIGTGVNAHTFLELGWVRIPQNTTSASAHVAFEFNQGTTPPTACPSTASDGLIPRRDGDLLLVYDFTGGAAPPTIHLGVWTSVPGAPCEVGSSPCWGPFTSLNATQAEANVDDGQSHICNTNLSPTGCGPGESDHNTTNTAGTQYVLPGQTSDSLAPSTETLQNSEFGEATIDLTNAGVFTPGTCTNFGQVEAVSRSSGDSGTAAMEDLVGPGKFTLSNCGTIKIIKHTDPRGTNQNFNYCTDVPQPATGGPTYSKTVEATLSPCTSPSKTRFTLNDTGNTAGPPATDSAGNTETITNVQPGNYKVNEIVPDGWGLESLSCVPSDNTLSSFGVQNGTTATEADITIAAEGVVTCTYQNQPTQGAILVTKTGKDKNCTGSTSDPPGNLPGTSTAIGTCTGTAGVADLAGASFEVWKENGKQTGFQSTGSNADDLVTTQSTGTAGTTCFNALTFSGSQVYYVNEKTAPTGYATDDTDAVTTGVQTFKSVTVNNSAKCADSPFGGETVGFTDTPLTNLTVNVASVIQGATNSSITCVVHNTTTNIGNSPQPASGNGDPETVHADGTNSTSPLAPGTYDCQVVVDP